MKAITILQPWASLIACGAKKIETRSWATKYRGPIAIHVGLKYPSNDIIQRLYESPCFKLLLENEKMVQTPYGRVFPALPLGKVIAIADLVDCQQFGEPLVEGGRSTFMGREISEEEAAFGNCVPGNYGWLLENVRRITPAPAKGQQRIWNWEG